MSDASILSATSDHVTTRNTAHGGAQGWSGSAFHEGGAFQQGANCLCTRTWAATPGTPVTGMYDCPIHPRPMSENSTEVIELTEAQARDLFDRRCREELGISGDEFLRRWDLGAYRFGSCPEAFRLAMLIPFGR